MEADKERIAQVISNLLNNAIKFTKEGQISIDIMKYADEENYVKKDSKAKYGLKIILTVKKGQHFTLPYH